MAYLCKLWLADRMVWLWNDMQYASPEYRNWQIQEHKEPGCEKVAIPPQIISSYP